MAGGSEGVEEEDDGALTTGTTEIKSDTMSASANAVLFMSTKPLSLFSIGAVCVVKAFLSRFLDSRFLDKEPTVHSELQAIYKGL